MVISNRHVLTIIERVGSVSSLLGCIFIVVTFCCSKAFHKPINRLVFYASVGNGAANIATLMSTSFAGSPDSAGCQTQGFMIQWLMPADALWTLAMAINVYLKFYHKYDVSALRRMEMVYFICCYGIPFVPAFTYLFIQDSAGNKVYGNAGLWCWVSKPWVIWRIITFYGPIWLVILSTLFIYIRTGSDIYRNHRDLRQFSRSDIETTTSSSTWVNTEIVVTTEELTEEDPKILSKTTAREYRDSPSTSDNPHPPIAYSVSITANNRPPRSPTPVQTRAPMSRAECSYAKCAVLFFTAMFITWIPSSANRVHSVMYPDSPSVVLEYMSAAVLPLQGLWNALIYILTSWNACKKLYFFLVNGGRSEAVQRVSFPPIDPFKVSIRRQPHSEAETSDSTTQLAESSTWQEAEGDSTRKS